MVPLPSQYSASKAWIRKELLRKRRSIERDPWLLNSAEILRQVMTIPHVIKADRIHCYVSMEKEREVFTRDFLEWLCLERKEVYLPYIERGRMMSARYLSAHRLMESGTGPSLPDPLILSDVDCFDAVIVPLVGFDRKGGRIGYGKGWYDRFFEALSSRGIRPIRIGLAFAFQELSSVPSDSWDELLDMVVTEREIINCLNMRA